jgi:hypothetical protein
MTVREPPADPVVRTVGRQPRHVAASGGAGPTRPGNWLAPGHRRAALIGAAMIAIPGARDPGTPGRRRSGYRLAVADWLARVASADYCATGASAASSPSPTGWSAQTCGSARYLDSLPGTALRSSSGSPFLPGGDSPQPDDRTRLVVVHGHGRHHVHCRHAGPTGTAPAHSPGDSVAIEKGSCLTLRLPRRLELATSCHSRTPTGRETLRRFRATAPHQVQREGT